MRQQLVLDLARADLDATAIDDVLDAVDVLDEAVLIDEADITARVPAVGTASLPGAFRIVHVPEEHVRAASAVFALLVRAEHARVVVGVDDLRLDARERAPVTVD